MPTMSSRAKKKRRPAEKQPDRPVAVSETAPSRLGGRSRWQRRGLLALALLGEVVALVVLAWPDNGRAQAPTYQIEIVKVFPHDTEAFCQGLFVEGDILYEGTGEYNRSQLRKIDLSTGRVLQSVSLNGRFFGEGITVWGDKIYQLTWQNNLGLIYDKKTLRQTGTFRYSDEGWGLTHDGTHLIISDGTDQLRFLDPQTFRVVRRLRVHDGRVRISQLNELEYVNGEIWANVWHSRGIVSISPETGQVNGYIDLSPVVAQNRSRDDQAVLNGIAYDAATRRLFVTGKNWANLYEIRVLPR